MRLFGKLIKKKNQQYNNENRQEEDIEFGKKKHIEEERGEQTTK